MLWRSGVLIAGVGAVVCRVAGSSGLAAAAGRVLTGLGALTCGAAFGLLCTIVSAGVVLLKAVGASTGAEAWISSIRLKRRDPGSGGFHLGLDAACSVAGVVCLNNGVSSGRLKTGMACPLVKVRLESEPLAG